MVMPFENETHELRYEWLGEGAASVLTEDLTALGAQALSREDRLRAFEHLRVPATNKLSEATIIRVAAFGISLSLLAGAHDAASCVYWWKTPSASMTFTL